MTTEKPNIQTSKWQAFKDAIGGETGGWVAGDNWECADCDAGGISETASIALYVHRQKARHWSGGVGAGAQ